MSQFPLMDEELELTEAEKQLLEGAHTGSTATINQSRVISEIYRARHQRQAMKVLDGASVALQTAIKGSAEKITESNAELAEKSREAARALNRATWVLAIATLALVLVTLIQPFAS